MNEPQDLYLLADTEEAKEMTQRIIDLLNSNDENNVALAFQLIEGCGANERILRHLRYDTTMLGKFYCIHCNMPFSEWRGFYHSIARTLFCDDFTFKRFVSGDIKFYEFFIRDKSVFHLNITLIPTPKGVMRYKVKCEKGSLTEFNSISAMVQAIKQSLNHYIELKIVINGFKHQKKYLNDIRDRINAIDKPKNCKLTCECVWRW